KPDEVRIESGAEDVELAEESGGQRHTDQRHQEDGEQPRRERLLPGESREVADVYIFLALPREMRDHGERADVHQRVGRKIEHSGRDPISLRAAIATMM